MSKSKRMPGTFSSMVKIAVSLDDNSLDLNVGETHSGT